MGLVVDDLSLAVVRFGFDSDDGGGGGSVDVGGWIWVMLLGCLVECYVLGLIVASLSIANTKNKSEIPNSIIPCQSQFAKPKVQIDFESSTLFSVLSTQEGEESVSQSRRNEKKGLAIDFWCEAK
ncbi:hypothetical protein QYF36_001011 [Acer negundo]|nr:hypothetical protein QYF36_001011 [Acer negundo]